VRVYLAATLPLLAEWLTAGEATLAEIGPGSVAYAVTPGLREWYREADLDELEHAAQVAASVGALELLAAQPQAPRRRVVVAADVAEGGGTPAAPDLRRAAIRLAGPVPVSGWGSALVDDAAAGPVVEAAVASLAAAAGGDDDAQFALDEAEAYELGWYAVQELRDLLG
jgi:hypothetical protein